MIQARDVYQSEPVPKRGRKPTIDLRDVLDALRYLARTGGD